MNVVVAIAGLGFLVLIHEAGHFFTALAVRMRPRKFYVFFPPPLVRKTHRGIEYGIGTIPLGGYVKIPGMHRPAVGDLDVHLARATDEAASVGAAAVPVRAALRDGRLDDARAYVPDLRAAIDRAHLSEGARRGADRAVTDIEDGLSDDAYWRAPTWKRIAVIAAGPLVNLAACIVILAIVFVLGVPVLTRGVGEVSAGKPAEQAGLRAGDEIVAIDGVAVSGFEDVRAGIQGSEGEPITVTVERNGQRVELTPVAPVRDEADPERLILGFAPAQGLEKRAFGPAVGKAFSETGRVTAAIGEGLVRLVTPEGRKDVASPVGIVQGSSETLDASWRFYLQLLAFISLSLAIMNLLPLLPLDGGHILFSLLERIRGRAIPREAYEKVSMVGIALVLLLFMIGLTNDIGRLG